MVGVWWCLIMDFICTFLMASDVEHLFMCLFASCIFFLVKCFFIYFAYFLNGLFFKVNFQDLILKSFVIWFVNIFLPLCNTSFHCVKRFFWRTKSFQFWWGSTYWFFSLWIMPWCPKKLDWALGSEKFSLLLLKLL